LPSSKIRPGRTDTASRIIAATPNRIYLAMVDAAALVQWLPPEGMSATMEAFEPQPGGHYRMVLRHEDPAYEGKSGDNSDVVEARFIDLVPDACVVQAIDFASPDPRFAGTMIMSWLLTPLPEGTEVRIVAENVPPGISAEDHEAGLQSSLANLARFVGG
jgi:uncharacterized protein YndB with AHSA1/START domain